MNHNVGSVRILLIECIWASLIWTTLSDCPFPKKGLANGRYTYQAPEHANLTIAPENYLLRFRCLVGHTMRGSKAILCASNQWTDKVPSCIKMQCNDPPKIDRGHYVLKTGVNQVPTIGSTATYSCDVGYELEDGTNNPILTCHLFTESNVAQWKGAIPSCKKKESCPDPGVSPDGSREGHCCFTGDVLKFRCNEDYKLIGNDRAECLSGGSWTFPRPLCKPLDDHCDLPPPIPHGVAKGDKESDFYRPYDEVEILCKPGFRYSGTTGYVMCEEESGWEEDFGECTEAFCDVPKLLVNGNIPEIESTNLTIFPFNFELTYICEKGFRLIGDSWRFCDTKGWSGKSPYCEVMKCPDPGTPEHGSRLGTSFDIGQKILFKCSTGYELIGSFERYCMPNGQWSGELARCDHPNNYCPDPGVPVNGIKNSSNYDMGERISFRCHPGFTLLGSDVRECLPDRSWSGAEAECIGPYEFDNSAKIGEILKTAVSEKEAEQKQKLKEYHAALFSTWRNGTFVGPVPRILDLNFPGRLIFYFAFDVSGSVKEHNFRKSVDFAKAIIKKVGISPNGARAGALTFSSQAETQFLPLEYETTESVLAAFDKLNYTGGGTSANSALTLIREELIPLTQAVLSKKGQKSIIFILTDGKANMGGDPQEEAENLKKAGVEIYCVGITNTVMQDSLYKIASDPKKKHVFILKNYATFSYLIQEITQGTIDYSQCGLGLEKLGRKASRGRITGGRQASEPWPWMAALYFITPGSKADLQCGGSIIHENYILSAAHCLFTKNSTVRREKDVIVKLGLTNVQNETTMQEFEVEKLFVHPQYRVGPIYDYDIALLQLKRPIEFSALVRPICLPGELTPNSTLYKPGQYAVATGWGHAGIVQKMQEVEIRNEENLKEVVLPIQNTERCMQSVLDNNLSELTFTDRMFCVGDGSGGNDTCRGDSGGPLMQSQQNEDGYTYWTQVGIVSWGIGCGLPNTYGYYSHVQKLHSWLMSVITAPKE